MKPLLNLFWQICLLRQSPARVPTYGWFVGAVVAANLLCSVIVSASFGADVGVVSIATSIIVGQAATALLVLGALAVQNLADRFVTTVTAIFGCDLIITACFGMVLPISALLGDAAVNLAVVMFLVWSVAVAGFILHRALDTTLTVGIGAAMLVSLLSVSLGRLAIGE